MTVRGPLCPPEPPMSGKSFLPRVRTVASSSRPGLGNPASGKRFLWGDISMLKNATGPWLMAMWLAMFMARALLPIPGRPAATTRVDGWRPPSLRSRSARPVGRSVTSRPPASTCSRRTSTFDIRSPDGSKPSPTRSSATASIRCSAWSSTTSTSVSRFVASSAIWRLAFSIPRRGACSSTTRV